MSRLYHGTLARNVQSIRTTGLLPRKGLWTAGFHSDAAELVFAVDENHQHRLILAITGQMAKADLARWTESYQFGHFNDDLIKHGAVVIVGAEKFSPYPPGRFETGHPLGTEPGDWYSRRPISIDDIQEIMTEQAMLDWLKPSVTEFVHSYREVLRTYCLGNLFPTLATCLSAP
jgi:hypothetical protein